MLNLLRRIIIGLDFAIWSFPLLVGIALVWSIAVIPWLIYSIMAGIARLVSLNSRMYTLPGFIELCARPLG